MSQALSCHAKDKSGRLYLEILVDYRKTQFTKPLKIPVSFSATKVTQVSPSALLPRLYKISVPLWKPVSLWGCKRQHKLIVCLFVFVFLPWMPGFFPGPGIFRNR